MNHHLTSMDRMGIEWCLIMIVVCGLIGWRASVFRLLRGLWWARQRRLDMLILWPACKEHARSLSDARKMFAEHAYHDPCWINHYGSGLAKVIRELK